MSLVGALLLSYFFLRSLRAAGVVEFSGAELSRACGRGGRDCSGRWRGWVGLGGARPSSTVDGGSLGLDDLPGTGGGGLEDPGTGDVGWAAAGPVGDLVDAEAAVVFSVRHGADAARRPTAWAAGV
ncbi:hypothetical protein GCM10023238_02620 [Streptomyces heliomycini]